MKVTKMNCKFMRLVSIKKPSRNNQSFAMVFTRMWPSSYNNYQSKWSACVCYTQYPSTEGLSILYRKNKCPFVFGCNKKHFNEVETEFQLHCQASRKYPWSWYAAETQFSSDTDRCKKPTAFFMRGMLMQSAYFPCIAAISNEGLELILYLVTSQNCSDLNKHDPLLLWTFYDFL